MGFIPKGIFHQFFPAAKVKKGAFGVVDDVIIPGWAVRAFVESYLHLVCLTGFTGFDRFFLSFLMKLRNFSPPSAEESSLNGY